MSQGRQDNVNDGMPQPERLLLGLPSEILEPIVHFVHLNEQRALYAAEPARFQPHNPFETLFALSRVNRRLHDVTRDGALFDIVKLQTITATTKLAALLRSQVADGHPAPVRQHIRHLHTPNEGLFEREVYGADYDASNVLMYGFALRTIFKQATNLETVFLIKNYQTENTDRENDALDYFVREFAQTSSRSPEARARLRHLTISCEPDLNSAPMFAQVLNVPSLSHLNLVSWTPQTLSIFGESIFTSLRNLRLSKVSAVVARDIGPLSRRQDRQLHNADPTPDLHTYLPAQFYRELTQNLGNVEVLHLELAKLDELQHPHQATEVGDEGWEGWCPPYNANDWNATLSVRDMLVEQISRAETNRVGPHIAFGEGDDFSKAVPLSSEQVSSSQSYEDTAEMTDRKRYWEDVYEYKTWLEENVRAARRDAGNATPFRVCICPSRKLVRESNELVERDQRHRVYAAQHCDDMSTFADYDVFDLVRRYPFLGYRLARDETGNTYAYRTGILPLPPQPPQ